MQATRSIGTPFLTEEEWASLFPRDDYVNCVNYNLRKGECALSLGRIKDVRDHSLKFLIALKQPVKTIQVMIARQKENNPQQLNSSFTPHKLTALMIAIMRNNLPVASALIEAGASLRASDRHGFQPIHHAALVSTEMVDLVVSKGGDVNSKTLLGATVSDLRMMAGYERSTKSYENVYCFVDGIKVQISLEEFERLQGIRLYTDVPYYPPERIKEMWAVQPLEIDPINLLAEESEREAFRAMKENPPKLIVGEDPYLATTLGSEAPKTRGLFAGEFLKFCQGVIEYSGMVSKKHNYSFEELLKGTLTSSSVLEDLDADKECSAAFFADEGWPNVAPCSVSNEGGRAVRVFFKVIDPMGIKKNKGIYWDYSVGEVRLKWNSRYAIAGIEEMHDYFKTHSLESLIKESNSINDKLRLCIQRNQTLDLSAWHLRRSIDMRLMFIFSTPAALIDLVSNKILDPKQLRSFLRPNRYLDTLYNASSMHMQWIEKLIDLMIEFESSLATLSKIEDIGPELEQQVRGLILGFQGKITTLQIIENIKQINEALRALLQQQGDLDLRLQHFRGLCKKIATAQPMEECYPLGQPAVERSSLEDLLRKLNL